MIKKITFLLLFICFFSVQAQEEDTFKVHPNPVTDGKVSISLNNEDNIEIKIYDLLGKLLINSNSKGETLDVSYLPSGVYLLNLATTNNNVTRKLIIR